MAPKHVTRIGSDKKGETLFGINSSLISTKLSVSTWKFVTKHSKMKFIVFVAFIAFARAQLPDSRCPPGTPDPPLHLNDPNNCTIFYTCVGGNAYPQNCPPGKSTKFC